jgi:hypothetical protein
MPLLDSKEKPERSESIRIAAHSSPFTSRILLLTNSVFKSTALPIILSSGIVCAESEKKIPRSKDNFMI